MEQWRTFLATPCWGSRPVWFRGLYDTYQWPDGAWVSRLVPGTLERVADSQASPVSETARDVLFELRMKN